jgi:hypothetical protein
MNIDKHAENIQEINVGFIAQHLQWNFKMKISFKIT